MGLLATPIMTGQEASTARPRIQWRETLLGWLFVAPATLITLIFGLYPVIYGFFVSLKGGQVKPSGFVGLLNYVRVLGGVGYIFALAVGLVFIGSAYRLWQRVITTHPTGRGAFVAYLLPALIIGPAVLAIAVAIFNETPAGLTAPLLAILLALALFAVVARLTPGTPAISHALRASGIVLLALLGLVTLLFTLQQISANTVASFAAIRPLYDAAGLYLPALDSSLIAVGIAAIALLAVWLLNRIHRHARNTEQHGLSILSSSMRLLALLTVIVLLLFAVARADQLRSAAMNIGQIDPAKLSDAITTLGPVATVDSVVSDVLMWPQVFAVLLGSLLLGTAYLIWQNAIKRQTTPGLLAGLLLAIFLIVGGWLLIGELPGAVASGSADFYNSLLRTATYAFVTVPFEMVFGLIIAYLLFHEITVGRSLFRIIYFIPYIAPTVATAAVFSVVFSLDHASPANQFMHVLGLPPQQWLRNPSGIFQIIARLIGGPQVQLPSFLVGPSLPLSTAIIFSTWVFSGYNAVIFMAGLGGVPRELYEAAEVDGASRWANFRFITLPMISPTTFFLAVLAIIGTFQALTHIYVLRTTASRGSMDVATVLIFDNIRNGQLPSASAMAFVLFALILVLTLVQNRVAKDQVFYG